MPYLLFVRYEDEVAKGVEAIHSSEARERLRACQGTYVRLHELGPLNHWMDDQHQKSFLNSVKGNINREQVAGLVENNRNKKPSNVISSLEEYLTRTAPEPNNPPSPPPHTARELILIQEMVAAAHRIKDLQAQVERAAAGNSAPEQRSWLQRLWHYFN